MRNKARKIGLLIVITYLLIEFTCYLFIKTGYIKTRLPDFHYSFTLTEYPSEVGDIDSVLGTWHYRGHTKRTENCMDFDYSINSWGARDIERELISTDTNRVFVLGDSFMEGYGMSEDERLSNLLEKTTKRGFINFSCQDFGTTQEYLIYKEMGQKFNHSTLLIGILPYNDFADNDTSIHANPYYKRFRPYFKGQYPNYKLVYSEDSIQKSNYNKQGFFKKENTTKAKLVRFLRAYTCWFNIVTYIKDYSEVSKYKYSSGYYYYTPEEWLKMCFILCKIRQLADKKRIIILTIPASEDIVHYRKYGIPPLHLAMDSLCRLHNMEYFDLLPLMALKENAEKLFYFNCDPHWNQAGNKFAEKLLEPVLCK
jgi:hypothetical protein